MQTGVQRPCLIQPIFPLGESLHELRTACIVKITAQTFSVFVFILREIKRQMAQNETSTKGVLCAEFLIVRRTQAERRFGGFGNFVGVLFVIVTWVEPIIGIFVLIDRSRRHRAQVTVIRQQNAM